MFEITIRDNLKTKYTSFLQKKKCFLLTLKQQNLLLQLKNIISKPKPPGRPQEGHLNISVFGIKRKRKRKSKPFIFYRQKPPDPPDLKPASPFIQKRRPIIPITRTKKKFSRLVTSRRAAGSPQLDWHFWGGANEISFCFLIPEGGQ